MIMIAIHVIPKAIRMIIQNAPKYRKFTSETEDGIIVDTIEDISPDQKIHKARYHDFGEGHEYRIRKKYQDPPRNARRTSGIVFFDSGPDRDCAPGKRRRRDIRAQKRIRERQIQ